MFFKTNKALKVELSIGRIILGCCRERRAYAYSQDRKWPPNSRTEPADVVTLSISNGRKRRISRKYDSELMIYMSLLKIRQKTNQAKKYQGHVVIKEA